MRISFAIVFILVLGSCKEEKDVRGNEPVVQEVIRKHEKNVPERFLRIDGKRDTLRSYELGKNLFGKFFKQRAEFYIIENPNKTIYGHPVKSITLYFLDGTLSKTKYALDDDISDHLIQSYGEFTIKGYDSLTRHLFKTEQIVRAVGGRKILNKNLTNYELKWELQDKFVFVRVERTQAKKRFEYMESLKNYHSRYSQVELSR